MSINMTLKGGLYATALIPTMLHYYMTEIMKNAGYTIAPIAVFAFWLSLALWIAGGILVIKKNICFFRRNYFRLLGTLSFSSINPYPGACLTSMS